ncbi:MAG TPA: DUF2971 domain-containing protein [Planctomycetota bacterium]|nr:DUF2971 domain-containing protein [Planctomycetota bacterium]
MSRPVAHKLFKYRSLATEEDLKHTSEIFLKNEIWFSTPASFNDPFDCQFVLKSDASLQEKMDFFREGLKHHHPQLPDREVEHQTKKMFGPSRRRELAAWESLLLEQIRDIRNQIGVFCLTEANDDIVMWSHYADKHQGICLEFAGSRREHVGFFARACKVNYQDSFPEVNPFVRARPGEKAQIMVFTKSNRWKYEREWRIGRAKGPGRESLPVGVLTSVILGARISANNRQRVLQWVAAHPTPMAVLQASSRLSEYGIKIKASG